MLLSLIVETAGEEQVIKGWDQGVRTMKKGEVALLTCKPEYAYGAAGSPPKIPSNATLQFEVCCCAYELVVTFDNTILFRLNC